MSRNAAENSVPDRTPATDSRPTAVVYCEANVACCRSRSAVCCSTPWPRESAW